MKQVKKADTNLRGKTCLFLDDIRQAPPECDKVSSYQEFTRFILENGLPDVISFDHDLGDEKSGFDCAKFLVHYCLDQNITFINFHVHSQNPVGKQNIESLLNNFNRIMSSRSFT